MLDILLLICTSSRFLQASNALAPIVVTWFGIYSFFKPDSLKAFAVIVTIFFGIFRFSPVKEVHPANAPSGIAVIPPAVGRITSASAVFSLNDSLSHFFRDAARLISAFTRAPSFAKAPCSTSVTVSGKTSSRNELQPSNALMPIFSTPFTSPVSVFTANVTFSTLLASLNAFCPISVTVSGICTSIIEVQPRKRLSGIFLVSGRIVAPSCASVLSSVCPCTVAIIVPAKGPFSMVPSFVVPAVVRVEGMVTAEICVLANAMP